MPLSKKAIEEYKKIHKKEYGKDLSDKEAYEQANNLIGFFRILYKVAKREKIKDETSEV